MYLQYGQEQKYVCIPLLEQAWDYLMEKGFRSYNI